MVIQNTAARTAALNIPYSVLYFAGIITGISIAILAVANIIYALKHPSKISDIVTMHTDDDDIVAEVTENSEEFYNKDDTKGLNDNERGEK